MSPISKESMAWLNKNVLCGMMAEREPAWHFSERLQGDENTHYDGPIPVEDVQRRLFDWEAVPSAVYVEDASGEGFTAVPGRQAIVRSDNRDVLGIFTENYQPHGYTPWLLNNVASLLDSDLIIGSAGLLKRGGVAFVQVELKDTIKTDVGLSHRPTLLATTSLDGSLATTFKRVSTFVCCDNTLSLGLAENSDQFKVKHTKNSALKISEARNALNILWESSEEFSAEIDSLTQTTVSEAQWSKFVEMLVPIDPKSERADNRSEAKRETLTQLWKSDPRVSPWKNTKLGVLQAVNTYRQHSAKTNSGTVRTERNMIQVLNGKSGEADKLDMQLLDRVLQAA